MIEIYRTKGSSDDPFWQTGDNLYYIMVDHILSLHFYEEYGVVEISTAEVNFYTNAKLSQVISAIKNARFDKSAVYSTLNTTSDYQK